MLLLRRFSAWQRLRHSARLASGADPRAAIAAAEPSRRARSAGASGAATTDQQQHQAPTNPSTNYPPPRNVYVHLPFCRRKCFYCDFPVEAIGGAGGASSSDPAATSRRAADRIRAYVDLVLREIDATACLLGPTKGGSSLSLDDQQQQQQPGPLLDTVYFGGGTPSLVPPALVAEIVDALDARFGVSPDAEVTLEADPGTFDGARLREYCAPRRTRRDKEAAAASSLPPNGAGVTRLSVGIQAFQDALLESCGRSHSLRDVREAVAAVRDALKDETCGLRSWSLDLICGLPGLSREAWAESLAQAVATGAGHVSVYDLQVEEGTPFARWYGKEENEGEGGGGRNGRKAADGAAPRRSSSAGSGLPDEDAGTAMYEQASEALRAAGYERYELSNYALLGPSSGGNGSSGSSGSGNPPAPAAAPSPHRSAHNQCYWRGVPYLAFGLGAASYVRGVRYSRPRDMRAYERWVAALEEAAAAVAVGGADGGSDGKTAPPYLWAPGLPHDAHAETPHERLLDRFMLALRTSDGLDLAALAREHGADSVRRALPALERAAEAGLAELRPAAQDGSSGSSLPYDWVRLTDPNGLMLSNDVISDVFALLD